MFDFKFDFTFNLTFWRTIIVFVLLVLIVNGTAFSQAVTEDVSTDAREIQERVPPESDPNVPESGSALNGSALYEDYTIGERFGIGALNIFGGAGSLSRGKRTGWLVTGIQGVGLLSVLGGVIYGVLQVPPSSASSAGPNNMGEGGIDGENSYRSGLKRGLITAGSVAIGMGVVVGFIIPFFHHRSANTDGNFADGNHADGKVAEDYAAQSSFPFNLELISSNGINGFSISYNMSF